MKCHIVLLLICFTAVGEVLFTEDFDDGNDDGWTHIGAANFDVVSQEYLIYSQGDRGQGMSLNGDMAGFMSTPDYSVLCTVCIDAGKNAGIVARYSGEDSWHYCLLLKPYSAALVLQRSKDTGPTLIIDSYSVDLMLDTDYLLRLQVNTDQIQGRIWTGTMGDEPDEWQVSAQDGIQAEAGSFGLLGSGYGKQKISWSMIFDDVMVSTPLSESFTSRTWASIKSAGYTAFD